jgi:hypothetical protein
MLYIATQLTMTVEEAASPHAIEFRVLGPRGESIAESDPINLPPQSLTSDDTENLGAVVFLGMQNVSLSSSGRYRFWLHVDGSPLKEALLRIDSPARAELATGSRVGAKTE